MRRIEVLQGIRKMRFEEIYRRWDKGRLTQEEAAELLGVCDRTLLSGETPLPAQGHRIRFPLHVSWTSSEHFVQYGSGSIREWREQ